MKRNIKECMIELNDYRHMLSNDYQIACVIDKKARILRLNQAWNKILGYDTHDLVGTRILELIAKVDKMRIKEMLSKNNNSHNSQAVTFQIKDKEGLYRKIKWIITDGAENRYLLGREDAASSGANHFSHHKKLLDESGDLAQFGIWQYDVKRESLYWSKLTKKIHEVDENFTPTLQNALSFYEDKRSRKTIEEAFNKALKFRESYDHQVKITTAKGNQKWVRTWGKAVLENGQCAYIAGTIQDITKEKNNEIELKQQKNRLAKIINAARLGTWEYNLVTGENRWNKRWVEILGYSKDELKPYSIETFFKLVHPKDKKHLKTKLDNYLKGKLNSYQAEFRMLHKNGRWVWVYDSGEIISRTEEGKPEIMYGIHLDITKQKIVQEQLEQSEKSFRSNFENAGIGMAIVDKSGRWIRTNQQLQDMLGYSQKELSSFTFLDITHPEDVAITQKYNRKLLEGKTDKINFKKRYIHKSSKVVHVDLFASAIWKDGKLDYIIAQIIDITKEVKLKNQLQNTVANLQAVMDASSEVAIIGTDENGVITIFNKGAEKMLGYSSEEVVGIYTPEHFHSKKQIRERARELEKETGKNISGFEVLIANTDIGNPDTKEWIKVDKEGNKIPVLLTTSAITKNGQLVGYLGINTDLSKIKASEQKLQKLLNITIDQNKKLKHFAHIVSHNIRGHSANIQKLVDLIGAEQPEMRNNTMLGMIKQASIKLRNVINDLSYVTNIIANKDLSRSRKNLSKIVGESLEKLKAKIETEKVSIINKVDGKKIVNINKDYALNIILCVLDNGITYSSSDRSSYIKIYLKENSNYQILHIEDNGIGFDKDRQEKKLYNMYTKMHDNNEGAGLDLFICKYQMEAMGGYIKIDSQEEVGTTAKLYFPKHG